MQTKVQRSSDTLVGFAVPASATGQGFDFSNYSSGEIRVPSGSSLTTLTWYSGDAIAGPWYACGDVTAQTVTAGDAYQIPVALFGSRFLLPVGNGTGTINLDLKA